MCLNVESKIELTGTHKKAAKYRKMSLLRAVWLIFRIQINP